MYVNVGEDGNPTQTGARCCVEENASETANVSGSVTEICQWGERMEECAFGFWTGHGKVTEKALLSGR